MMPKYEFSGFFSVKEVFHVAWDDYPGSFKLGVEWHK